MKAESWLPIEQIASSTEESQNSGMQPQCDSKLDHLTPVHLRVIAALWFTRFLMGPLMLLSLWLLPEGQKKGGGLGFVVIGLTSIARYIVTRHARRTSLRRK